jgi:hypothetical protein
MVSPSSPASFQAQFLRVNTDGQVTVYMTKEDETEEDGPIRPNPHRADTLTDDEVVPQL